VSKVRSVRRKSVGSGKRDLVSDVAAKGKISKRIAADAIKTTVESITDALRKGDRVELRGLGTFSIARRQARSGRNPQTGEPTHILARNVAKFTPGSTLKKAVNRPDEDGDAFLESLRELSEFY